MVTKMLEAIGLIGGALTRLFTAIVDYKNKQLDHQHELDMIDKQISLSEIQYKQKIEELTIQGNFAVDQGYTTALQSALEGQFKQTGIKVIDGINALIRPVLTIWWCIVIYTVFKACLIYTAVVNGLSAAQMAVIICDEFDRTVIAAIVGFFFTSRALISRASGR